MLSPLPVQGSADDKAIMTHDERSLHEMINVSETIMQRANLDVKATKCAVLYRRSENNWYADKNDKKPNIVVQNKKHQSIEKK